MSVKYIFPLRSGISSVNHAYSRNSSRLDQRVNAFSLLKFYGCNSVGSEVRTIDAYLVHHSLRALLLNDACQREYVRYGLDRYPRCQIALGKRLTIDRNDGNTINIRIYSRQLFYIVRIFSFVLVLVFRVRVVDG